MLLSYRGSHYEFNATKTPQQQDFTTAKYRGVNYKINKFTTERSQNQSQLKYRGATYINRV